MPMYHATLAVNRDAVAAEGIRPGVGGVVFLANRPEWAAAFVAHLGPVAVFAVELDELDLELLEPGCTGLTHPRAEHLGLPPDLPVERYHGIVPPEALTPLD